MSPSSTLLCCFGLCFFITNNIPVSAWPTHIVDRSSSFTSVPNEDDDTDAQSAADSSDTMKGSKLDVISSDPIEDRDIRPPHTAGTSESADMSDGMDTSVSSDAEEYGDNSESVNGADSSDSVKTTKLDVISSDPIEDRDLGPPRTAGTSESTDMSDGVGTSVSSDAEEYGDNSASVNGADSSDSVKTTKLDVISSDPIEDRDLGPPRTAGTSESTDMSDGMDTSVSSDAEEYGDNSESVNGADSSDSVKTTKLVVISSDPIEDRDLCPPRTAGTSESADMSDGMDTSVSSDAEEYGDNSASVNGADSSDSVKTTKLDVISSDPIEDRDLGPPHTAGTSESTDMSDGMDTSVSSDAEEYGDNSASVNGADSSDSVKTTKLDVISSDPIEDRDLGPPHTAGTSESTDMSDGMDTSVSSDAEEYGDNSASVNGADSSDSVKTTKLDVISSDPIEDRDLGPPHTAATSESTDMSDGVDTSVSSDAEEYGDNSASVNGADSSDSVKTTKLDVISSDPIEDRDLGPPHTAGTSESTDMSDGMDTSVSSNAEEYGDNSASVNGADSSDSVKTTKSDVISSDPIEDRDLRPPRTAGTSESADMSDGMDTSVSSDAEEYGDNSESVNGADSSDSVKTTKLDVISSDPIEDRDLGPPRTAGTSESTDMSDGMDTSVSSDAEEYGDNSASVNGADSSDSVKTTKLDVISSDPIEDRDLGPPRTAGSSDLETEKHKKPTKSFKQAAKEAEITGKIVKTLTVVKLDRESSQQ